MNTLLKIASGSLLCVGAWAHAQTSDYTVSVARVQVDMTFQTDSNGNVLSSSTNISTQSQVAIDMQASTDADIPGFEGVDTVTDCNGSTYLLGVGADTSQNIVGVSLVQMQFPDSSTFTMNEAATDTASLNVVNIAPLTVSVDASNNYNVTLTAIAYAPASTSNMVTKADKQALSSYIMQKIQPALKVARLKFAQAKH